MKGGSIDCFRFGHTNICRLCRGCRRCSRHGRACPQKPRFWPLCRTSAIFDKGLLGGSSQKCAVLLGLPPPPNKVLTQLEKSRERRYGCGLNRSDEEAPANIQARPHFLHSAILFGMKLLFVHERLRAFGGAETNLHLAARELKNRRHHLALLHGPLPGQGETAWREIFEPCMA